MTFRAASPYVGAPALDSACTLSEAKSVSAVLPEQILSEDEEEAGGPCDEARPALLGSSDPSHICSGGVGALRQHKDFGIWVAFSSRFKDACTALSPLAFVCLLLSLISCLFLLLSPADQTVGGPLGEKYPIGDNTGYKGPTWRKDRHCGTSKPIHDTLYAGVVNPDMLGSAFTQSSAAFWVLWQHFFSAYLPLYGHFNAKQEEAEDHLFLLTGEEAACSYRVQAASRCTDTPNFGFPLAIPRPASPIVSVAHTKTPATAAGAAGAAGAAKLQQQQLADEETQFGVAAGVSLRPHSVSDLVKEHCVLHENQLSLFSSTMITGLWNLPAPALVPEKNPKTYLKQLNAGLNLFTHQGMVVFADSFYMPLIKELVKELAAAEETARLSASAKGDRQNPSLNSRVCIVPLELEGLPYASLAPHIRLAASAAIRDPRVEVGWWNHPYYNEAYHVLQTSKLSLVQSVSVVNPFNSDFFLWSDPPRDNYYPEFPEELRLSLDGLFLSRNVKKGAILMQRTPQRILKGPWTTKCHKGVFESHAKYGPGIIGGLLGGTKYALERVLPFWDSAMRALLSLSILNDEQHLHALVACWFPSLFHVVPYHPHCRPHFVCLPTLVASAHPEAQRSWDLKGRQLEGPQPKETWKDYPYPVDTTLGLPQALYVAAAVNGEE